MNEYFIKTLHPPTRLIDEEWAAFAEGTRGQAQRFSECAGFLARESISGNPDYIGTGCIFARGTVRTPGEVEPVSPPIKWQGKDYPYRVSVNIERSVSPKDGIPLETIYALCPRTRTTGFWQQQGGIIKIEKEEFEVLSKALDALR